MDYFTHYWKSETVESAQRQSRTARVASAVENLGSELFHRVRHGDTIYVINYRAGDLRVIARLVVDKVVTKAEAKRLLGFDPWDASQQIIGRKGSGAAPRFDAVVPPSKVVDIRFLSSDGARLEPKRNRRGGVDPQTFRGVRRISEDTAKMFNDVLGR